MTEDMKAWAKTNAPNVGAADHEQFLDYWRAATGSKSVKKDWVAAWRVWMRKENERRGNRVGGQNGTRPSTTDQRVKAGLDLAAKYEAAERGSQLELES